MSRTVALQLAERLLLKMISQNKLEAEAEVQLYLIVLEKQVCHLIVLDELQVPAAVYVLVLVCVREAGRSVAGGELHSYGCQARYFYLEAVKINSMWSC